MGKNETYLDIGAFNGDTLRQFLYHAGDNFKKYIGLEPDKINFKKLLLSIPRKYKDKVILSNCAAGNSNRLVKFFSLGKDDSRVSETGTDTTRLIRVDTLCRMDPATTIKMDVEGYEPFVLAGSRNIIRNNKPKLAVCVYHRPYHLWSLLTLINKLNPCYKYYMRHHDHEVFGTVLYAL